MSTPAKSTPPRCSQLHCESTDNVRFVQWRIPMSVNRWYPAPVPVCAACRKKNYGHWRYKDVK